MTGGISVARWGIQRQPHTVGGIWQFHRDNEVKVTGSMPRNIGELGPGANLGTCIAALLDGVESAIAFDAGNWSDPSICAADSLDLIFSHSVMEHVADPAATYTACHRWLKPGGVLSHKVDHSSHGITRAWNGHYFLSDALWSVIYGNRPCLLNRMRPRQYIAALREAGFELLPETRFVIDETSPREITLKEFPDDDCFIRASTLVARKRS